MQPKSYFTNGGIRITREIRNREYQPADTALAEALDQRRGVLFSSSFEYPGRYTRWDMGFVDPPLVFTARGRRFSIEQNYQQIEVDGVSGKLSGNEISWGRFRGSVQGDRISGEVDGKPLVLLRAK